MKFYFFLSFIILLGACSRRYGCIYGNALNYDEKAVTNDGSCWFVYKGIVYWEDSLKDLCVENEIDSVNFYLNDQLIKEYVNVFVVPESTPYYKGGCNDTGWVDYSFEHPKQEYINYKLEVKNAINNELLYIKDGRINKKCEILVID